MTASTDPSSRYVLPPDAPYLNNMAALWQTHPALAREVERHEEDGAGRLTVQSSRVAGAPTLTARTADGRVVSLHSKYDPIAEAGKLIDAANTQACVAFYVLGIGLGYHLEALFDRASDESLIFVFEPDVAVLRAAMEQRNLSRAIASGRVYFFAESDKSEVMTRLTPMAAMCSMGLEGVTHAPSLGLHPEYFRDVQTWIAEYASFARTSLNTLVLNGRRTAENIARNLAEYIGAAGVNELKDAYKGKPAIIVSAGPSLRKNQKYLKDAEGKAVFIAVQTVLRPLLAMGIEPQFVTSLDYHDISARYYEDLPAGLQTRLVAEPKASPKIFEQFGGPLTILGNDFADRLLREFSKELDKGRLQSGATVAHLAFYLAEHLGCEPIIFVGQDLGFSDALAYAPGTSIDDVWRPELGRFCTVEMRQWEFVARERPILRRIPDFEGKPMYTEERLYTYLQQFERDFMRSKSRVIDATEGGARKRGAATMKLAEAIREFCTTSLPAQAEHGAGDGKPGQKWVRAGKCVSSLMARREEARQIEFISHETLPLLEEIRDHVDDQPRVNRAIARIDALRGRLEPLGPTYDLVTQLTQRTELKRFQRDRQIHGQKLEGLDLQRKQIERDLENVRAVAGAAKEFQELMDDAIGRLKAFTDPGSIEREAA